MKIDFKRLNNKWNKNKIAFVYALNAKQTNQIDSICICICINRGHRNRNECSRLIGLRLNPCKDTNISFTKRFIYWAVIRKQMNQFLWPSWYSDEPKRNENKKRNRIPKKGLLADKVLLILFARNLNNHKINSGINNGDSFLYFMNYGPNKPMFMKKKTPKTEIATQKWHRCAKVHIISRGDLLF